MKIESENWFLSKNISDSILLYHNLREYLDSNISTMAELEPWSKTTLYDPEMQTLPLNSPPRPIPLFPPTLVNVYRAYNVFNLN